MNLGVIQVTERSTAAITKAQYDALENSPAFWQLAEAGIVSLVRTRDCPYGIKAQNLVGDALITPDIQVRVREKISGALRSLLQSSLPEDLRTAEASAPLSKDGDLLALFASRFVESIAPYLSRGRKKRYIEIQEASITPRGRLDRTKTARIRARRGTNRIIQQRSVLTADIVENRILAQAIIDAEIIVRGNPLFAETLTAARLFSPTFQDANVSYLRPLTGAAKARLFEKCIADSSNFPELRRALLYARPIVLHSGIWASQIEATMPESYFLNLESLFEEAVRHAVKAALSPLGWRVSKGAPLERNLFIDLFDRYRADPDIVAGPQAGEPIIVDCKYKDLDGAPAHSDVYQLMVHCECFNSTLGILFYPDEQFSCTKLGATARGVEIWCAKLRPAMLEEDVATSLAAVGVTLFSSEIAS